MGEAKRRQDLGLPQREKKKQIDESDRFFSWLPLKNPVLKNIPTLEL